MIYIFGIYIIISCCLFQWLNSERKKTIKRNFQIKQETQELEKKWENINNNIQISTQTLEQLNQNIVDTTNTYNQLQIALQTFQQDMENKKIDIVEKTKKEVDTHQNDLQDLLTSIIDSYNSKSAIVQQKLKDAQAHLLAYQEDLKRKQEIENQKTFYTLELSNAELTDVEKLLEMSKSLNYSDVLRKLVYKTFFEKKMNDLLGRVAGAKAESAGVYKITHIDSGMVYIGQTTNLKERWRKHLKCGLGIDTPSTNSFYQGMLKYGVWNFTWEVIEFCSKDKLNEIEKYWIDFYQTNIWGWNSKGGNSK